MVVFGSNFPRVNCSVLFNFVELSMVSLFNFSIVCVSLV